jgi:hypothetical protein
MWGSLAWGRGEGRYLFSRMVWFWPEELKIFNFRGLVARCLSKDLEGPNNRDNPWAIQFCSGAVRLLLDFFCEIVGVFWRSLDLEK